MVGPFKKILHAHNQRFPPSSSSLDPVVVVDDSSRKQGLSPLTHLHILSFDYILSVYTYYSCYI